MKVNKIKSNKKSISSKKWLKSHFSDIYVKQAKKNKLRSRAWFKLDEIDRKEKLFKPGVNVLDLGSSPGGWSQYVSKKTKGSSSIIAYDILPMNSIEHVNFFKGNICDLKELQNLIKYLKKKK